MERMRGYINKYKRVWKVEGRKLERTDTSRDKEKQSKAKKREYYSIQFKGYCGV